MCPAGLETVQPVFILGTPLPSPNPAAKGMASGLIIRLHWPQRYAPFSQGEKEGVCYAAASEPAGKSITFAADSGTILNHCAARAGLTRRR